MAELIVARALLAVDEHAVRFACFFEFFFRLWIPGIAVRVILHRQFAVRALDLLIAGAAFYAQNFVIIAFCLCGQIYLYIRNKSDQKPCRESFRRAARQLQRLANSSVLTCWTWSLKNQCLFLATRTISVISFM